MSKIFLEKKIVKYLSEIVYPVSNLTSYTTYCTPTKSLELKIVYTKILALDVKETLFFRLLLTDFDVQDRYFH
jgi:hypothetical protein